MDLLALLSIKYFNFKFYSVNSAQWHVELG